MGKINEINVYDKIMIENQKQILKSTKFLHKSQSNRWFRNGSHISQLAKSICCQRERWHHLPYV